MIKNLRIYVLLIVTFFVSSCSVAPTIYNNVDWLVYFYLDDYVDLNRSQKVFLDARIKKWHAWHRSSELQKYKTDLISLREQLKKGPKGSEEWLAEIAKAKQHMFRLRDEINPDAITVIQQLSDDQVMELLALWRKNDGDETKAYKEQIADKTLRTRLRKTQKFLKEYVGALSPSQTDLVNNYAIQVESDFFENMDYNAKLRASIETIYSGPSAQRQSSLSAILNNLEKLKSPELIGIRNRNEIRCAELLSELNKSLNKKQQKMLVDKLKSHIEMLDGLML